MRCELQQLATAIEDIQQRSATVESGRGFGGSAGLCPAYSHRGDVVSTGIPAIDSALCGGVGIGRVHEWFSNADGRWFPPLSLLMHVAQQALGSESFIHRKAVIWIGRRCWPYSAALIHRAGDCSMLEYSILVDPPDDASRLWVIDLALRCRAVAAVIADGSRLDIAASRRLQLAAEAGRTLGLLARPSFELDTLSTSTTRWLIQPMLTPTVNPRWTVQLLRRKGMRPLPAQPDLQRSLCWTLEYDRATGALRESSELVSRSGPPEVAAIQSKRISA